MQARYLLIFRLLLSGTLLLYWTHSPTPSSSGAVIWALLAVQISLALTVYWLGRTRRIPDVTLLFSFLGDVAITSLVLYLNEGFQNEFYVAYFLVILSTCFLEKLWFSLIVGGTAFLIYAYFAYPGSGELSGFYLLRSSLLMVTAFFSAYVADSFRRIQQMTGDRYAAELAWMQRLSMVGQAMAAVLHEAKTPLGTISLCVEQIREYDRRGEKAQAPLDRIEQETDHVLAILNNFLDLARPRPLELKPLDVDLPLNRALEAARLHAQDRDIVLEAELGEASRVLGSERHLVQAFTNIMLNAVHAMPLGGRLSVKKTNLGGRVELDFTDTGTGMTPETLSRLSEPFFSSRPDTGHGLGLTVVRWVVDKHSGQLALRSPGLNKGTTVTVSLPACQS